MARHGDPASDTTPAGGDRSWPILAPETAVTVVKIAPDGIEVTRYPGTVIEVGAPHPWVVVAARWTNRRVDLNGLAFVPGDTLHEYFSPVDHFNVFAVFAPYGLLRGWYANVTYPTSLDLRTDPPTLTWHDLYVDVVALPSGMAVVRDEDELLESGLAARDPALHATILATRDAVLARRAAGAFPFDRLPRAG